MSNLKPNFSEGLKRARKNAGYKTQQDFADALPKSLNAVQKWEQGKTFPSLGEFIDLCQFFDCDADYLLGNIENVTHDLDFVCKYTGLSAEAIKNTRRDDTKALSLLLEDDKLLELLEDVADLYHRTGALTVKLEDINANGIDFNGINDLDYMYRCTRLEKNDIQNAFGAIVERLVPTNDTLSAAKKILREYGVLNNAG